MGGAGTALLIAANVYFAVAVGSTYFPGDPPAADLILEQALVVVGFVALGIVVSLVISVFSKERRGLRTVAGLGAAFLLLSIVGSVPTGAEIAKRHLGEWAQLQDVLRQNEQQVLKIVGRGNGKLSRAEIDQAKSWYSEHPVYFRFRELKEPVQVRPMSNTAPYVGVDFGRGANAMFDLSTMICTYSD